MKHYLYCEAPICADERCYTKENCYQPNWKKEIIWYPGEPYCKKRPYTKWQKRQARINRWLAKGEFKHGDKYYFTVEMLMRGRSVRKGRRGGDPDARTYSKD